MFSLLLLLATTAMSASEHAIVEAFGVPLAVDPGDLSAKGFSKKGKDISYWDKHVDAFFDYIKVTLFPYQERVLSVSASRDYRAGSEATQFQECMSDFDSVNATILARYPTLKLNEVRDSRRDRELEKITGRNFAVRLEEPILGYAPHSNARSIDISCFGPQPWHNGEPSLTRLTVYYEASPEEVDEANKWTKKQREEKDRERGIAKGLDPAEF